MKGKVITMRKSKVFFKIIAIFMSILLVLQILPFSVIAANIGEANSTIDLTHLNTSASVEKSSGIIGEVETLRDEYTKHFRREDGSFVAAIYSEPVHYIDNGVWKEIDNTIEVDDMNKSSQMNASLPLAQTYSVSKTSTPITFPSDIKNGSISVKHNDNTLFFAIEDDVANNNTVKSISTSKEALSVSKADNLIASDKYEEKLSVDTNNGKITYNNAFSNAYLTYETSGSMLKESIIVPSKSNDYTYKFIMNFGTYFPVYDDLTGGIYIYETEKSQVPVMAIAPAYMFDASGETSDAVSMKLEESGSSYKLTIEADTEWINSDEREFPVVIDPTLLLDVGRSGVYDVHVNSGNIDKNYKLDYQLEVGRGVLNNVFRTYIKFDLPELPDCSVVTYAQMELIQNWARNFDTASNDLLVYTCSQPWNFETITWDNQPVTDFSSETLVDYEDYKNGMSTVYNLNITKIAKNWYENGNNNGLMICSSDESVKDKTSFYSSRNIVSNYPVIIIQYVNNVGLENYWDYETVSLGKSGTAYINTYNGGLTYRHSDATTKSLIMPLEVSHVFSTGEHSKSGEFLNMKFGKGFKLNLIEKIESVNSEQLSDYPYKYIDSDGTVHFFKSTSTVNRYCYEFGSDIILTSNSNGYTITFPDGSKKIFNSNGYLIKAVDSNNNSIEISYTNGRITQATDSSGISFIFSYNDDNTLYRIYTPLIGYTDFSYSSTGLLTQITYPDGNRTAYEYDSNSNLSKVITVDSAEFRLGYKSINNLHGDTIYRVESVSSHSNDSSHEIQDSLLFDYRTHDTLITNNFGDKVVIAFDNVGRAVNKTLNDKTVVNAQYNTSENKNNKLSFSSNTFSATNDLLNYKPVNIDVEWEKVGNVRSNSTYYNNLFDYFHDVTSVDGKGYIKRRLNNIVPGETYTVSAYINIFGTLTSGEVAIKLVSGNSSNSSLAEVVGIPVNNTNNEWQLITATIETPSDAEFIDIYCGGFSGYVEFSIDAIWAEKGNASNRYNFVNNSSFEQSTNGKPDLWRSWGGNATSVINNTNTSVKLSGTRHRTASLEQSILNMNGKAGDTLVFGSSSKALCSASGNDGNRFFGIRLRLHNCDDSETVKDVLFNKDVFDTWQTVMGSITADKDYSYATIELHYDYEINSVLFDDVFLYKDSYATYYDYNSNGTVKKVTDDNGNELNYSYTGVDLTGVTAKTNGIVTQELLYSYNNKHNLVSASQSGGASTSYTYNDRGLPLTVTVTDSEGQHATTTYTYHSDLNYLTSVTDSSGATTQYDYTGMAQRGLVTKVTDPNGNVTEYTYDDYTDNVISIANPDESLGGVETNFTYDSFGKLETVSNQNTGYKFYYDNFGRENAVETIDGYMISCNSYYEDGNLESVYYANNASVEYEYDEDGRVSAVTEYGEPLSEYAYTNEGRLSKLVDHENDRIWLYQYDIAGRLKTASSNDGKLVSYSFNSKNEAERVKITEKGENVSDTTYSYDSLGRVSGIQVQTRNYTGLQSYEVDGFGRLNSSTTTMYADSPNLNVTKNYTYLTHNGNQTGRVGTIEYTKNINGNSSALAPALSYTYDANGNITYVYENGVQKAKYYYDSLNRLIREDNAYINKTVVYNYNSNGDILSKVEYALTSSESLGEPTDTITYEYGDDSYPNVLTSYDGQIMYYDYSGNITQCGTLSLGWTEYNQLGAVAEWYRDEEGNRVRRRIDYTYDTSGIRTSKTVDGVKTEYFYVGDKLVKQSTDGVPDNDLYFSYSADGSPFCVNYDGTNYYYLLNLQGDVIGLYIANGTVVVSYVYDSWGKLISSQTTSDRYDTLAEINPLRYRSYVYDNETQLYYLQARYYNPEWGRFINADSLLVAGDYLQGLNRYAYCFNNPVRYSDPSGYSLEDDYPATYQQIQIAVNLGIVFGTLKYFAEVLNENDFNEFCTEYIVPNKNDLKELSDSLLKLYIGSSISGVLASLSQAGNSIDTLLGFTNVDIGKAGYAYSGFVGLLEIASVAFDPLSSTNEVVYSALKTVNEIAGGILAGAIGTAVTSAIVSSGGTGAVPIIIGVLTAFVAGEAIDYIIDNI